MNAKTERLTACLDEIGACEEAIEFVRDNNIQSIGSAIEKCERPDWIVWLAHELRMDDEVEATNLSIFDYVLAHPKVQKYVPKWLQKYCVNALEATAAATKDSERWQALDKALYGLNERFDNLAANRLYDLADAIDGLACWRSSFHMFERLLNTLAIVYHPRTKALKYDHLRAVEGELLPIVCKHITVYKIRKAWKKRFNR